MPKKTDYTILEKYLGRHQVTSPFLSQWPTEVEMIVVVPVYLEEEYLTRTLESLFGCEDPAVSVGVILVFNSSEIDDLSIVERQKKCAGEVRQWFCNKEPGWMRLFLIEAYHLRRKHFGAGLARKIGMDAAVACFHKAGKPHGVIVTLDADVVVATNYFTEIKKWFSSSERKGASLYFEHPLEGKEFPGEIYEGIIYYELHLRYYLQAQRYAGFPHAYHTMGSAMAVRAWAYASIGGMPKKQAGEDFYFLQKLIPTGGFGALNTTTVFPSPRPSDRVIFGTGAAISGHINGSGEIELTYNFQAFEDLKIFLERKSELFEMTAQQYESWSYEFSGPLRSFLLNSGFFEEIDVIKKDCASRSGFDKRFFEVFNAFKIVKYLNYVHEKFFEKTSVFDAAITLLEKLGDETDCFYSEKDLLLFFRQLDKESE